MELEVVLVRRCGEVLPRTDPTIPATSVRVAPRQGQHIDAVVP